MTKHPLLQYMYIFNASVLLLYIANIFIDSEQMNYILGLFAIMMIILSYIGASRLFKVLGSSFLIIGGFLYFHSGELLIDLPSLLTSNMSLLALLMMLPWMNVVVRSGRFDRSLHALLKVNVPNLGKLYMRSTGITLILTSFLNLSAASISQDVLKENLNKFDKRVRDSFISISTLRGFSLAVLWSPLEILLAVTIFMTGISYVSILPWLLLIGAIIFMFDALWGRFHFKKYPYISEQGTSESPINIKELVGKIIHLVVALALFLILVILLGSLFDLDFILTVTLLIFPFSFIWAVLMKRWRRFWVIGWNAWKDQTNHMYNFILLFISLSLFSYSIGQTSFLDKIQQPILAISEYPLLVFFLIQMTFILMSMFGIHPIATIGILGSLLSTLLTVYNPLSIAVVFTTSAIATIAVGTYGLLVTMTSMTLELNPYRITLSNLLYSICFGSVGSVIGYLLL